MANPMKSVSPNVKFIATQTDSLTVQNCNDAMIEQIRENAKHKKHRSMIGKWKLEDTLKIKGKRVSEVMSKYLDNKDIEEDYEKLNKENKLITGDGGGCGKTHENTTEYINSPLESRFLNPTHIANKNINDKLVEIGCKENMLIRQNRIDVIASIFTK